MTGRDKFSKFKPLINFFVVFFRIFPIRLRKIMFIANRNVNGIRGIATRYVLLKSINPNIGDNVSIHPGCYIFSLENLEIGRNVSIHPMCYIDATGGIKIGNDVSIAHGTTILSTSHSFNNINESIKYQEILKKKTTIESNVWIGSKATILYGIKIGEGSIVGASSFINKNVPINTIVYNELKTVMRER